MLVVIQPLIKENWTSNIVIEIIFFFDLKLEFCGKFLDPKSNIVFGNQILRLLKMYVHSKNY